MVLAVTFDRMRDVAANAVGAAPDAVVGLELSRAFTVVARRRVAYFAKTRVDGGGTCRSGLSWSRTGTAGIGGAASAVIARSTASALSVSALSVSALSVSALSVSEIAHRAPARYPHYEHP